MLVFMPLERLFSLHPRQYPRKTFLIDVGYYFINGLVPGLLLALPLSLEAYASKAILPTQMQATISAWPLWQAAIAAIVINEFGNYWGHRWMHSIPFLWRFHSIHHSPAHVYFLTSAHAHPVDKMILRFCGLTPVFLLGIASPFTQEGRTVSAILLLALTLSGFFIHSSLRWRLGWLDWVFVTPAFHHWHHTLNEHRDRNFTPMLPWMDWMFGTLHLPKNQWPSAYGIEENTPDSLGGQLLHPLRPLSPTKST